MKTLEETLRNASTAHAEVRAIRLRVENLQSRIVALPAEWHSLHAYAAYRTVVEAVLTLEQILAHIEREMDARSS